MANILSSGRAIGWVSLLATLWTGAPAQAHDPGLSSLTVTRGSSGGTFSLVVDDAALPAARRASSQACDASSVLGLTLDGETVSRSARCIARDGHTAYEGAFTVSRAGRLTITVPLLDELPRGHRSFARAVDDRGNVFDQRLLEHGDDWPLAIDAPPRSGFGTLAIVALLTTALTFALWSRAMRRRNAVA